MREMESFEEVHRRISTTQLPLSPPLTPVPTNDSTSVHIPAPPLENGDEGRGPEEVDITSHPWHALERAHLPGKEDEFSLHDRDSLYIRPETEEKRQSRTNRRPARLDLEFRKPSPQPWDIVDPPPENNDGLEHGYYSPVHSATYATQQNAYVVLKSLLLLDINFGCRRRRRRPLIPRSAYYSGPAASDSAYGTPPAGQIGIHHPREIVRIERDYAGGELIQFLSIYPVELDGRVLHTPIYIVTLAF
jgi:hypothetical protein